MQTNRTDNDDSSSSQSIWNSETVRTRWQRKQTAGFESVNAFKRKLHPHYTLYHTITQLKINLAAT